MPVLKNLKDRCLLVFKFFSITFIYLLQVNRELMSVIESLQRQTKEMEENTASEEEMLNTDEKNNDVKEEDEGEKLEAEVKDVNSVADDISDSANEAVKESDEKETITKPSPKANKKRKAGVKDEGNDEKLKTQVKDSTSEAEDISDSAKEAVKESDKKAVAKPSPKANKKRKAGVTENAPNKKLHEETEILKGDDINDTANENNDTSLKPEVTKSKEAGVDEVGKELGPKVKKTSKKQKKDGDAKCSSPTGAGARTRSKKA